MYSHPTLDHGGKIKHDNGDLSIHHALNNKKDKVKFKDTCYRYGFKSDPKVQRKKKWKIVPIQEEERDSGQHQAGGTIIITKASTMFIKEIKEIE